MAFEMICGQCRGNLLVEQFGVVVACPHCGAHLHVPAPETPAPAAPPPAPIPQATPPAPPPAPEPVAVVEAPAPAPVESISEAVPLTEEMNAFTGGSSEPPPSVEISVTSPVAINDAASTAPERVTEEAAASATGEGGFSLSALMSASETAEPEPPPVSSEAPASLVEPAATTPEVSQPVPVTDSVYEPVAVTAAPSESVPSGLSGLFGSSDSSRPPEIAAASDETPVATAEAPVVTTTESPLEMASSSHEDHSSEIASGSALLSSATVAKPSDKDHVTVSKSLLLLLFSYASAITLGFLYLLYYGSANKGDYGLESLPDPVPPKRKTSGVYQESAPMPDGHDLKIGDRQRFGNIEVTVLKVTRGPIKFRHFSDAGKARFPSAPVLKLWLRFKNVSDDQEIAPLDDQLLFHRIGRDRLTYHSNQFVVRAEQKANPDAKRIIAYDHIIGSGWDLVDLPLDKSLQPGESRDYYVPTCENDLDILKGELLWRVHIRKGYSSRGNGVTTIFEVRFNSNVVADETA